MRDSFAGAVALRGSHAAKSKQTCLRCSRLRVTDLGQRLCRQLFCCVSLHELNRHPEVRMLFACASKDHAPTPYGAINPICFLRLSNGFGPAPCAGAIVFTSRLFAVMTR